MKKKIIYISGAETFDVSDVKSAFEEVRVALKLDKDVLLFGVPVDDFEANVSAKDEEWTDSGIETDNLAEKTVETVEPVAQEVVAEPEIPVKPRAKRTKSVKETSKTEKVTLEPEQKIIAPEPQEKVVPILSVLATGQTEISQEPEIEPEIESKVEPELPGDIEEAPIIDDEQLENIPDLDNETDGLENQNMYDILNDDMPSKSSEKTLEELFATIEPLREDVHVEQEEIKEPEVGQDITTSNYDDSDELLKTLASEYAEKQEEIPRKKTPSRGIQRLKSVLPFSRQKKEDPGIMGDLFGWAGIAANDEEFTMPGFFTNVASKK